MAGDEPPLSDSTEPEALAFASAAMVARSITAGALSPEHLLEVLLARIAKLDPQLHAFTDVWTDSARTAASAAARAVASGAPLGPLHGVPVTIKEMFVNAEAPCRFGGIVALTAASSSEAVAAARLRRAGAILLGTTNLDPFAFGSATANPHFGDTRNPWRLDCRAGGSSGGAAAAVAAGLGFAALGSDTGVSIRQPAALCGIVGLKPTHGAIPLGGAMLLSPSLDHLGPLTRSVADAELLFAVLAGRPAPDNRGADQPSIQGTRVATGGAFFLQGCCAETIAAFEAARRTLTSVGARVVEADFPDAAEAIEIASVICRYEAARQHAAALAERPDMFPAGMRVWLADGLRCPRENYDEALRRRHVHARRVARFFGNVDAIITPTTPIAAEPITIDPLQNAALRWRNTGPFIGVSLPAISVPCGFTGDGRPIGLQIVGRPHDEACVFRVAAAFEQATPRDALPALRQTCGDARRMPFTPKCESFL